MVYNGMSEFGANHEDTHGTYIYMHIKEGDSASSYVRYRHAKHQCNNSCNTSNPLWVAILIRNSVSINLMSAEQLKTLCLKDVSEYSLDGQTHIGKVVDVYDGDTCKIILLQDGKFVRYNCRLDGIDAAEMRDKSDNAYRARNRLAQLLTDIDISLDYIPMLQNIILPTGSW